MDILLGLRVMFRKTLALLYQNKDVSVNTGLIPALTCIPISCGPLRPDPTTSVSFVQTFEIE